MTYSDLPDEVSNPSRRMQLLAWLVWGALFVSVAGFLVFASRGQVDLGIGGSLRLAFRVIAAVSLFALVLVVVKKLLAISRGLALLALLLNVWMVVFFIF